MLSVRNLSKKFGNLVVYDNFSRDFPEGELSLLSGPSGCGKTTLFNMILGIVKPDSGYIDGIPDRISVVFQEDRLCEGFSAAENVTMVNDLLSAEQAVSLLLRLGISEPYKPVSQLSGGQKRRVAIARALAFDAPLILLDEPYKGLDAVTKNKVVSVVDQLTKGKTVILISH